MKNAENRRNEIARFKIKVGDKVKLLMNVRDAYGEIYLGEGETVEIENIHTNQVGYEYEVPYGFCISRDDFEKVRK